MTIFRIGPWMVLAQISLLVQLPLCAQGHESLDQSVFLERARQGTAVFQDRSAAVASGYRLVGPDFPGMGEHWVNTRLIMQRVYDPARPAILTYANVDGRSTLVGVAYALPVDSAHPLPERPAEASAWHYHSGTVDDESFLPTSNSPRTGIRLAVLHAWIWTDNPAGVFARNNWSLPYVRAGLTPSRSHYPDASRALALIAGNESYYRTRFTRLAVTNRDGVNVSIDETMQAVRRIVSDALPPDERDSQLSQAWSKMCKQMGGACQESHGR